MKINLFSNLSGIFGLFAISLFLFVISVSMYGLVLAFKASLLIGVLALFIEPAPFVIGMMYLFSDINLAQKLADFLF
jgi:hypothetical protein